jgi:pyridinium-3,5-bisthiocarboxylic acid mononucleotide nickel chelatase
MDLHLIAAGMLTGDMFIAAGLDAFPHLEARVLAAADSLDELYPVSLSLEPHADYEVTGRRLAIEPYHKYFGHIPHAFADGAANWRSIRERLDDAQISVNTRMHARKIFELICAAESQRQGVTPERVVFGETAGWHTLAQVAGAAALIEALEPARWSASPSPARQTDVTGNAIIEYLCPIDARCRPIPRARLVRSGAGYSAHSNNVVRLLCFEEDHLAEANEREPGQTQQPRRSAGDQPNY